MLVYIINKNKIPLMPCKPTKARKLLQQGKAKVITLTPFVIQLNFGSSGYKQQTTLGVDAGSKHVGLSVTTEKQELFSLQLELRTNIVDLLSTRRQNRRARRNRKTRYRKPRFLNRTSTKKEGWLAPSIQNKIETHVKMVDKICKFLPITNIIVETASFDIQKIKNPDIQSIEYQQGNQLDFGNVREYVFFRDGHKCHGKLKCNNKILNVHHIESRKTGGNSSDNLITLCEDCHKAYHKGTLKLNFKRGQTFKDAIFMGIMRWSTYNKLKEMYPNIKLTYGYITKTNRINNKIEKSHTSDAYCITGNLKAKRLDNSYFIKQVRRHNRQIHKCNILKCGIKKRNQSSKYVFGFQLFDKVNYNNKECFIFGRRASGSFDIRQLDGTKLSAGINYKKLKLIEKSKTLLWERRARVG